MKKITDATPGRAAVIAAALVVVNPKVLLICAEAGLAIGSAGLGTAGAWMSEAFYVLIAASSVAIPVLAYAVAGERLDGPLGRFVRSVFEGVFYLGAVLIRRITTVSRVQPQRLGPHFVCRGSSR